MRQKSKYARRCLSPILRKAGAIPIKYRIRGALFYAAFSHCHPEAACLRDARGISHSLAGHNAIP